MTTGDIVQALAKAKSKARSDSPAIAAVAFPRGKTEEGSQQRVLGKSGSDGDVWIATRQSIMIVLPNDLDWLFLKTSLH